MIALAACGGTQPAAAPARAATGEFRALEPAELWQTLRAAAQVFVFDNNRPETYALAHVPGAVNLRPADVTALVLPADKAAQLVFYCANEH